MKNTLLLLLPLALAQIAATAPLQSSGNSDIAIEGSLNEILIGGGTGMAARSVTFRHRQLIMYPDWAIAGNKRGECKIQIMYKLANLGSQDTPAFKVRHYNHGQPVGLDIIEPISAGSSRWIHSQGWFSQGRNTFEIRLDADQVVAERDEANNLQAFDYTLERPCNARHKPTQPGSR
jgi:hypothetical protein